MGMAFNVVTLGISMNANVGNYGMVGTYCCCVGFSFSSIPIRLHFLSFFFLVVVFSFSSVLFTVTLLQACDFAFSIYWAG